MDGDELNSAGIEGDGHEWPKRGRGRLRWIGAGVAVVVIAVVAIVVALGGGGGGGPLNAIAKAAEVTEQEPGGHATINATVTSSTQPEGITESGSMTFDESGKAEGTVTGKVKATGEEVIVETIVDGTESYTTSEKFESLPEGKKWVGLDLSSVAATAGSSSATAGGPNEGLKILETVEDAEEVGKDEIDGVPTTQYRGTLPIAGEVFGVKLHASARQVEVWIDAQGRVRRMHVVVSGSVGESKESSTTDMTIDYVEFGQVPAIKPPAPDEVFDATSQVEAEVQTIH